MRLSQLGLTVTLGSCLFGGSVAIAQLSLPESPLFVGADNTALVQLVLGRDNKLFFEAYPSYEDINADGVLDTRYKPDEIDYSGYFNSHLCYYEIAESYLQPNQKSDDKKCATGWSGDFLNFLTMTRMDLLRFALYGGKRVIDTSSQTRLRRAFVPKDYHTWGIEYESVATDGYDITQYSPLSLPSSGTRHLLATNNKNMNNVPYLRIRENQSTRIYQWTETESVQGAGPADQDIALDVNVCVSGFLEENCQLYPNGNHKPTGILHEYSVDDAMYFSLLTGSYENNLRGGVLRETMKSFSSNEVIANTGQFATTTGIVRSIDAIQIHNDFSGTTQNDCPGLTTRAMVNGECSAWGNPIAEMMYEGLRYFAGSVAPTAMFHTTGGIDASLGLQAATWDDPYAATQPYAECSPAYQLVISDPSPSYDSDDLPGSHFSAFSSSDLGSLNVSTIADTIHATEFGGPTVNFIGESGSVNDRAPSPKEVTSFKNIRGQSPGEPHRKGSYYASSVSYYGNTNDIHPTAEGQQRVSNFAMTLGRPIPTIDVDVQGTTVSFAPFSRTVGDANSGNKNDYAPINAIVGFTVESLTSTSGSYRVSFEDREQGADNDMDALVRYSYTVSGSTVVMNVSSIYAAGTFIQHSGYAVSGTNKDGVYLVVRDQDTQESQDFDFFLDVPPGKTPGDGFNDGVALPLNSIISFNASSTPSATQLKSPLWYAAKWGGFVDDNNDGIPQQTEWDSDMDGNPDNYLAVNNPALLRDTLRSAFDQIDKETASATAIAITGGSLNTGDRIYQSEFISGEWSGQLRSFSIGVDGSLGTDEDWNVNTPLQLQIANNTRSIITYNAAEGRGVAFQWPENPAVPVNTDLSPEQITALNLNPVTLAEDGRGDDRLSYLRGNSITGFRDRSQPLGDVVHSSPVVVGAPAYYYPDYWAEDAPENVNPYSTFARSKRNRQRVVYVGANDGMLHAFDAGSYQSLTSDWSAGTGEELFAYIPNALFSKLSDLTAPKYEHKYYVDATPRTGDAHLGDSGWRSVLTGGLRRGAQGIYALDITAPESISEDNAAAAVLWEYTDADDSDLGYTYSSPLIVRLHNGKWAAVFGNGYNNTENDGHVSTNGESALYIVDLETGILIKKFLTGEGTTSNPNGMAEPTAVDLDGDNIIDLIYAGDLYGHIWAFDVSSSSPGDWTLVNDESRFQATFANGSPAAITTRIAVGTHPEGTGVMLYAGTGKFLEEADLQPSTGLHRLYGLWDKKPFDDSQLTTAFSQDKLLQQTVTGQSERNVDTDSDDVTDTDFFVRTTSQNAIDWSTNLGWHLDLRYSEISGEQIVGEQIVTAPVLREGRVIINTMLPDGDPCDPDLDGWLMIVDAASGAMSDKSPLDLNSDGDFQTEGSLTGIRGFGNPLAPSAIATAGSEDVIVQQSANNATIGTISLDARISEGRLNWRELEP